MRSIVVVTLSICPFAIALFPESKPADSPGSRAQSPDTQADEGSKEVEVFPSHPALYKATRETKEDRILALLSSPKVDKSASDRPAVVGVRLSEMPDASHGTTFLSSINQPPYQTTGLSRE